MRHLSREEQLEIAEGIGALDTIPHLSACQECRDSIRELKSVLAIVPTEVPEPSPLFWNQLSSRVREAVAHQPAPAWYERWFGWRAAVLAGSAAALVLVMVIGQQPVPEMITDVQQPGNVRIVDAADAEASEASLSLLGDLAQDLDWDSVVEAGLSAPSDSLEGAFTDLTADEQAEVQRILTEEISRRQGA